jgi:hypothetical protein
MAFPTAPAVGNKLSSYCPESDGDGEGEGDDSGSGVGELFVSSAGVGEASALVVVDFFFAVVDDEDEEVEVSSAVEVFFLAVAVVDALVVPGFFVVAVVVVVDFLPVAAVVLAVVDSFLCAQETTKTAATRRAIKEKTDFFIGFVRATACSGRRQTASIFRQTKPDSSRGGRIYRPSFQVSMNDPTFGSKSAAA